MRGIWAAALNPFSEDLSLDEAGLRSNIRHWIDDLDIQGLFIAGKQGEFFSMSLDERMTIANLGIEMGAKALLIHPDGLELPYGFTAEDMSGEQISEEEEEEIEDELDDEDIVEVDEDEFESVEEVVEAAQAPSPPAGGMSLEEQMRQLEGGG